MPDHAKRREEGQVRRGPECLAVRRGIDPERIVVDSFGLQNTDVN